MNLESAAILSASLFTYFIELELLISMGDHEPQEFPTEYSKGDLFKEEFDLVLYHYLKDLE